MGPTWPGVCNSSSGPAALQGHMPSSSLECWLALLPAWALSRFLLPLSCLSQASLFGGQGGHGGARHPQSAEDLFVTGFRDSQALIGKPDSLMGKRDWREGM